MTKVVFRCMNCNAEMEKQIMATRHAVLGTLPKVNEEATCCRMPDYEDMEGFHRARREQGIRDFVPGVA